MSSVDSVPNTDHIRLDHTFEHCIVISINFFWLYAQLLHLAEGDPSGCGPQQQIYISTEI